jgi:predicted protein tyrosine phosphatase
MNASLLNDIYLRLRERTKFTPENCQTIFASRNQPSHIPLTKIGGILFLSGISILSKYQEYHIDHIISIVPLQRQLTSETIQHDILPIEDTPQQATVSIFAENIDRLLDSIHKSLLEGKRVAVHCQAGVSRSATVVIAYMMKYEGLSLNDAVEYVSTHRPAICPNRGFLEMLASRSNNK